jgi:hypothetical protein
MTSIANMSVWERRRRCWMSVPHKRIKSMKLAIFGANGPTGRLLTKQAGAAGHTVTAVTRHPETFPLHHERLQVMQGDVYDLS